MSNKDNLNNNLNDKDYISEISAIKISKKQDEVISGIETRHAELKTKNALEEIQSRKHKELQQIKSFEQSFNVLQKSQDSVYKGSHLSEANALTQDIITKKNKLISDIVIYIENNNKIKHELEQNLDLTIEKSNDFEEQLENALEDISNLEKELQTKDEIINQLTQSRNRINKYYVPMTFVFIFYSYLLGYFGISQVIYFHLYMINLIFYICIKFAQTIFSTFENSLEYIIYKTHTICSFVYETDKCVIF